MNFLYLEWLNGFLHINSQSNKIYANGYFFVIFYAVVSKFFRKWRKNSNAVVHITAWQKHVIKVVKCIGICSRKPCSLAYQLISTDEDVQIAVILRD